LPHVDDIAVQYKSFRPDGFQVTKNFLRMASVGTKMNIGQYYQLNIAFFWHRTFPALSGDPAKVPKVPDDFPKTRLRSLWNR
jgi:hypothetical protein